MAIKVFPALHLFAAQHVCSWGAEGKRAAAVCSNPCQLHAEKEDVFLQVRSRVLFCFFFFILRLQSKTKQTQEDANRLLSKCARGLCRQTSSDVCTRLWRQQSHVYTLLLASSFSQFRDSLVLTYTDVAPPLRDEQIFSLLINKQADPCHWLELIMAWPTF